MPSASFASSRVLFTLNHHDVTYVDEVHVTYVENTPKPIKELTCYLHLVFHFAVFQVVFYDVFHYHIHLSLVLTFSI